MTKIKHDIWENPEGLTSLIYSDELGAESRSLLEQNSKIIHSFYAESHFEAMTKYYEFMNFGIYETEFEEDKELYDLNKILKRAKFWQNIDTVLWEDWDPIGINDSAPRNEYRSYIPVILNLVLKERSVKEIAEKLFEIETEIIGVSGSIERCDEIAQKIATTR